MYLAEKWWEGGTDNTDTVKKIVAGSHCFAVAIMDGRIIGMGRAISDRISDAYIQDVTVSQPHRGNGIGSRLVSMIILRLNQDNIYWIGLIAEKNANPFYEKLGFSVMANAAPMLRKTYHEI